MTGYGDRLAVQGEKDRGIRDYLLVSSLHNCMMVMPFHRYCYVSPTRLYSVCSSV